MCLIGLNNGVEKAAADLRVKKLMHVSNRVKQWGNKGQQQ